MITEKLQVKTPTKEDYIKVVQCMLDNGNVWRSGDKGVLEEYWDICKENTTVEIGYFENGKITYNCPSISGHTAYTTQEFINKYGKKNKLWELADYGVIYCDEGVLSSTDALTNLYGDWCAIKLEDNNKTMNIKKFVKTLTLSKEDKLLREYGLQNDCGDFTEEARELVINKLVEENKAYLVEIATKLKEEDKKYE